jgi:hypothetical protein
MGIAILAAAVIIGLAGIARADDPWIWKGGGSPDPTAWEAPGNWTGNAVPVGGVKRDVEIPAGCAHDPVVTNGFVLGGKLVVADGARITVAGATLVADGGLHLGLGAAAILNDGAEIWSDVTRQGEAAVDVGLKLTASIPASGQLPGLRRSGGPLPEVWLYETGPAVRGNLVNIAPLAERQVSPYMAMTRNVVDPDPHFRTLSRPEAGVPAAVARYSFRFEKPQQVAQVRWNSPYPRWALLADTTGSGAYDRLLALDLAGHVTNTGGVWVARTTVAIAVQPPVKVWGIRLVDLNNSAQLYDFQILTPKPWWPLQPSHLHEVMAGKHLARGIPEAVAGEALAVATAPAARQIPRGFHIEPWMFDLDGWIDLPDDKRPPLSAYPAFTNFIASLRLYHANTVNMWPPRKFNAVRGKGTYESDLLWTSAYERHSLSNNMLAPVAAAFREAGIRLMTMTRVAYPKPLEDFPASPTVKTEAPYVARHSREYLSGIVREQVRSGVAGVGIGFDEQQARALGNPKGADAVTRAAFKARTGLEVPDQREDSLAFRKWVVFAYEEFAAYLGEAARAAKTLDPAVLTKSPVHLTLGTLWNDRVGVGIAEDIVARRAEIDYSRANSYLAYEQLGHYITALSAKVSAGGRLDRKTVSLHNCPWAPDPKAQPGFYLHFPPVYMLASPISSVMHGGGMPLFWRYNWIFRDGYEKQVQNAYAILETLSAWGLADARTPKSIAVLRSRAAEDWWQIRQRHREGGDRLDQTRGHLCFKVVVESLLTQGYPFDVVYLDHPEELDERLRAYDVVILPFPYSVSSNAFAAVARAAAAGKGIVVFDKKGETDEWGEKHPTPLFDALPATERIVYAGDDLPAVGQHAAFNRRFAGTLDRLLGDAKPLFLNTYGNDVEAALLEKGAREKFLALINWTERPVTIDAGVRVHQGHYQVRQAGTDGPRAVAISGKGRVSLEDLARFRVTLAPWDVRVLNVYPSDEP